jgi:hypothetical protein
MLEKSHKGSSSFLKKKNQKTLMNLGLGRWNVSALNLIKVFARFFQKALLTLLLS